MEAICFEQWDLRCRGFDALTVLPPKNPIPNFTLLSIDLEHQLRHHSTSLPLIPDDAGAVFASKHLTTDTDDPTTAHYRHEV